MFKKNTLPFKDEKNLRLISGWLWLGAFLVFLMVIIGGITRLTGSGLSMSDWNLIMGTIPPLNADQWQEAFKQYQQFPEYQQLNHGMSLFDFKQIFFWEYLHRLLGRMIGLVFLIPFLYFWIRGYFDSKQLKRMVILFGLGALQGAMGWFMVKSGLVDIPYVSHYRLAAHFLLAVILIGCCVWFAIDLRSKGPMNPEAKNSGLRKIALLSVILFFIQITWGAFTAGLDAGLMYNTFPLMNGSWIPQHAWSLQPLVLNLLENRATVQWIHRIVGTLLTLQVLYLWWRTRSFSKQSVHLTKAHILLGLILSQYVLGILTLLFQVPVVLGVAHQAVAILFWVAWLMYYHELKEAQSRSAP